MILVLVSIISYDVWFYISHIALHHKIMYEHHKLHHSKIVPRAPDTYLASSVETVFQGVGVFFPAIYLQVKESYTVPFEYLILTLFLINVRGMMAHDHRFVWLIGNHHLLHHKYNNCNYGQFWIDFLMGTCHPKKEEYRYGIIYT
jgi:sterol desaturase/sphingolipid hydroxylase (fatty acid hydroxylase superfamily)